jgi:hypothetical protein
MSMLAALFAALTIGCSSSGDSADTAGGEGAADGVVEDSASETNDEGGEPADASSDSIEDVGEAGDEGGADIVSPECAIPEKKSCNALCNTGCSDDKQCLFVGGAWECVTPGEAGPGEECANVNECAAGVCAGAGDDAPQLCYAPCLTDADCKDAGLTDYTCSIQVPGALPFRFCSEPEPPCPLFDDTACPEGEACYVSGDATVCAAAGEKTVGDKCTQSSQCQAHHTCISVAGVSGCVRTCDPGGGGNFACAAVCGAGNFDTLSGSGVGYCSDDIELPFCEPLNPTKCAANQGCYNTSDGWICQNAGVKEEKEPCAGSAECLPGFTCFANKCRVICDTSMPNNNPACASAAISCVALAAGGGAGYCDQ